MASEVYWVQPPNLKEGHPQNQIQCQHETMWIRLMNLCPIHSTVTTLRELPLGCGFLHMGWEQVCCSFPFISTAVNTASKGKASPRDLNEKRFKGPLQLSTIKDT